MRWLPLFLVALAGLCAPVLSGDWVLAEGVMLALVLLHPNLSGHQVPAFTRLLAGSSLGRSMLRPLLRSEVSRHEQWA